MQIELQHIVPIPLEEKIKASGSELWNSHVLFEQGQFSCVTAASGTGKTTLSHFLYGIRKDYKGAIQIDSQKLIDYNANQLAALRAKELSIVFQDLKLFEHLSAWENIEIKRCLTNTVAQEQVNTWLERLGIADKKQALTSTLSYGEQQRLAIVRALVQPFQFIILDEPFSHLDLNNKQIAAQLIREVSEQNKAGLILLELDENTYFSYHQKLTL